MGEGIILKDNEPLIIRAESLAVGNEKLIPGSMTSMAGYFKHPIEYCGVIKKNTLVFFIGTDEDLFEKRRYYQVVHLINENRLFSMFSNIGGRDFNFINGKWK